MGSKRPHMEDPLPGLYFVQIIDPALALMFLQNTILENAQTRPAGYFLYGPFGSLRICVEFQTHPYLCTFTLTVELQIPPSSLAPGRSIYGKIPTYQPGVSLGGHDTPTYPRLEVTETMWS